jgi:hypothetical protein
MGMKLAIHLLLVPWSKIRPLPHMSSWRGAYLIKGGNNFTFYQRISKMDLRKIGCEDGSWKELAQDRVQWRTLMLGLLNLRVLLPENQLISKTDRREMGCEDGSWMELAQDRVQWRVLVLAVLESIR